MEYRVAEDYQKILEDVIENVPELQHLKDADLRIICLGADKEKKAHGKLVFGECKKVDDLYKTFCPYDFIIIIYDPNAGKLNESQLSILIEHELMHVGYGKDEKGNPVYSIIPHDFGEFERIEKKYGLHWYRKEDK